MTDWHLFLGRIDSYALTRASSCDFRGKRISPVRGSSIDSRRDFPLSYSADKSPKPDGTTRVHIQPAPTYRRRSVAASVSPHFTVLGISSRFEYRWESEKELTHPNFDRSQVAPKTKASSKTSDLFNSRSCAS